MTFRTKQVQPRRCSSVRGLGWHSAHNVISQRRQGLPFCSGVQVARGLGQCLPQSSSDVTGSLHTARALGLGVVCNCPSFPGTPPASANAATSWWKTALTARSLRELFLRVQGRRLVAKPCLYQGQEAKELLLLSTQRTKIGMPPAQTPSSEWSSPPALVEPSCLLSLRASFSLHTERVTHCLPPARCSCEGRLSCIATIPDNKVKGPFSSLGATSAHSPKMLLGSTVTDLSVSLSLFTGATRLLSQADGC